MKNEIDFTLTQVQQLLQGWREVLNEPIGSFLNESTIIEFHFYQDENRLQ